MVRTYGRLLTAVLLGVAAALSIARFAMAAPSMTAEEVAEACIADMQMIEGEFITAVGSEAINFYDDVIALPDGAPIGKVFKMGAASSARIDKFASSAASRVEKSWLKCLAKIQRMNGDGSLLVDIAVAHDQALESIEVSLQSRQGALAETVQEYIQAQ